jgi:hypothetical protein
MRKLLMLSALLVLIAGCKTVIEDPDAEARAAAEAAFKKNSEIVLSLMESWQSEDMDYSVYSDDFLAFDTAFNAEKDEWTKAEMEESYIGMFAMFDFKMLSEPNLLPGVHGETKMPDGSVRQYSEWEVTRSATDSTEAKSGKIRLYHSFEFNDEGKISYQMGYGDFGALMTYLMQ